MANFLDRFKIKTAWESRRHTKDLSCEHITTSDFMKLQPVYYHNMIPKEKIEVDFRAFSRLAAMPVPTFGRANLHVRAFFVPFRVVMNAWNDFITDAVHNFNGSGSAIPSAVRKVTNTVFLTVLQDSQFSTAGSATDYDFIIYNSTTTPAVKTYYKFTGYGRHVFKVLESLGYHLSFNTTSSDTTAFSALPLLAAAQVYLDWYWPSAYVGSPNYQVYKSVLQRDAAGDTLTVAEVTALLTLFNSVNYDSDYFVSAFDNPSGPNTGLASDFTIPSIDSAGQVVSRSTTLIDSQGRLEANTPVLNRAYNGSSDPNIKTITQYTIESLHRLSDYLKRHQLAGARALDRYLARFGVQLTPEKLDRSVYLGSHTIPMMTGDVMSTSDTLTSSGGSHIGDYAGKGFLVGNDGHFEFETTEYGLFLICASIVPEVGYYQGIDRHNMHLTRLDFFTPEFDGMGTRAIAQAELMLSLNPNSAELSKFTDVFGFTPQYSEYKVGRDWLTGDYRLPTLNQVGDTTNSWHLFRHFDVPPTAHSEQFVTGVYDRSQYNRIFYNTSTSADHFYMHYFFGVKSTAALKPLYDDYDFHNDEGGERVLDVNGVRMN